MKHCEEIAPLLSVYLDGECTPEETARVREHLRVCPACRELLREYGLMRKNFPDDRDVAVPPQLSASVMSAIRSGRAPQQKRRCPGWKKVLVPLAACLVVALALPNLSRLSQTRDTSAALPQKTAVSSGESAKESTSSAAPKAAEKSAEKTSGSSQKTAVSDSAAPDDSSSGAASDSSSADSAAQTPAAVRSVPTARSAAAAACHKWVSVSADDAGSLLDAYSGEADTDPASGQDATRYELTAEQFAAVTAQIPGVSVHVNAGADGTSCCVYVLGDH